MLKRFALVALATGASLLAQSTVATNMPTGTFNLRPGGYYTWNHISVSGSFQITCLDGSQTAVILPVTFVSATQTVLGPNPGGPTTMSCFASGVGGGGASLPVTTNLIAGDGSGGAADSGIAGGNVATLIGTQTLANKTVDGVSPATMAFLDATSSVQGQLNGKEPSITGGTSSQFWDGAKVFRTLVSGDIPNNAASTSGNAGTATGLQATPTLCPGGQAPTGILANGNATGCAAISGGGTASGITLTAGSPSTTSAVVTFYWPTGAGDLRVSQSGTQTITFSAGASTGDTAYVWVSAAGTLNVGTNSAQTITCSPSCTYSSGVTGYPFDVTQVGHIAILANNTFGTITSDYVGGATQKPVSGSGGITCTESTTAFSCGNTGFTGTKTAGSCVLTISNGLITNVTGC